MSNCFNLTVNKLQCKNKDKSTALMIVDKFPGHKFGPDSGSAEKSQEMAK